MSSGNALNPNGLNVKAWLNEWLHKQTSTPNAGIHNDVRPVPGRGHPSRFKCELRVTGIPYIGVGTSTSKKDAQTNAAHDFCQYLIREYVSYMIMNYAHSIFKGKNKQNGVSI